MPSSDRRPPHRIAVTAAPTAVASTLSLNRGAAPDAVTVDSDSLLNGRPRIAIRHRDDTYWLHETRHGKLLLTK